MSEQTAANEPYHARAASWADDQEKGRALQRRLAWYAATGASVIAIAEAYALAALSPLKTVQIETILVDRHTGYVQALDPLKPAMLDREEALIQSLLVQYVTARETYDLATIEADYRRITLWSAENARREYIGVMQPSNPDSPYARNGRKTVVSVKIKSVSPLGADRAMVRFDTYRSEAGATSEREGSWVAVLAYRFSGAPMETADRYINPLGFQIFHYRRDAEILDGAEPPAKRPAAADPVSEPGAEPTAEPFARAVR